MEEHIASLDADLKSTSADLYGAREQVTYYKAENQNLHDEMAVINQVNSLNEMFSIEIQTKRSLAFLVIQSIIGRI